MTQTAIAKVDDFALRHPITKEISFEGVVLPKKPPIDKVYATALMMLRNSTALSIIEFWDNKEVPLEKFAEWRDLHLYPIDLMKYHEVGVASATDYVAIHLGLVQWSKEAGITESNLSPGFEKLRLMINKNNQTGHLKGMAYSIPHILREAYELDGENNSYHAELVSKAVDVLESFAAVENGNVINRTIEELEEALPEQYELLANSMDQPLTLGRYLRDQWLIGRDIEEVRSAVAYWLDKFESVGKREAEARKALDQLSLQRWSVAGVPGIILTSVDPFILKAVTRDPRWGVRIVVNNKGHTTISSNGLDLGKVAEILNRNEPGLWYYHDKRGPRGRAGTLINGGVQYTSVPATGYSAEHLKLILQSNVQPAKDASGNTKPVRPERQDKPIDGRHNRKHQDKHRGRHRHGQRPEQKPAETALGVALQNAMHGQSVPESEPVESDAPSVKTEEASGE